MKTTIHKIGGFYNIVGGDKLSKTYVYAGIQKDGAETVYLKQYILSETLIDGWDLIKSFKRKKLFKNEIHIRFDSLIGVLKILDNHVPEVYEIMRKQLTQETI